MTLPQSSAVQSLYLLQNISLSLMVFLERSGFFAALLDTRPSSKSLRLTVRAYAFTPACCHHLYICTFSHLADAFIQSDLHMCDLQCIHILHFTLMAHCTSGAIRKNVFIQPLAMVTSTQHEHARGTSSGNDRKYKHLYC